MNNKSEFKKGDRVNIQTLDWNASIIKNLNNEMIYVTTPDGLDRDVNKNSIRYSLFGDILTEFSKNENIIVITNYLVGIIDQVFQDSCFVKLENSLGRAYLFRNIRKITDF